MQVLIWLCCGWWKWGCRWR